MLRSLAKNSFLYYLSTILTKGISFFLLPLYTSILTQENYGVLELMSIISTIVIILFTFQIGQGVARYYNELRNQKHTQIYTSSVAFFSILSFTLFTVICLVFLHQIAHYINLNQYETLIAILSISLNGLFYLSQNQLAWKIKPLQEMFSSLTYNLVTIGCTIYFLVYLEDGIVGVFKAQCIGAILGTLVGVFFTRNDYGWYFSFRVLKKLFQFSLPLLPGALSIFIYNFTDRICIKEMLGLDELGVYSVGNKIATILTFTGIGVSAALSPLIYKHYKEKETPEKIALLFRVFSSLSFLAMIFLAFLAEPIIKVMTNADYSAAISIIPFLLFAIYLNSLTFFFPGLSIGKKTSKISLIATTAGVINLILNIVLIPHYGILAAAMVTCISFGINFYLLHFYGQKEYPINVSLKPLLFVSLFYFFVLWIIHFFELSFYFNLLGLVSCVGVSLAVLLKKKDIKYIKERIALLNR